MLLYLLRFEEKQTKQTAKRWRRLFIACFLFSQCLSAVAQAPLILFSYQGKTGFVNQELEVVIEPIYLKGGYFSAEGHAAVQTGEMKWAVIDRTGRQLVSVTTPLLWHLTREAYAYYGDRGVSIIKASGDIVLQNLSSVEDASESIIPVRFIGSGWTYVDLQGKLLFGERYFKRAGPFSEGLAVVTKDDWSSGCIDRNGRIVVQPRFDELGYRFSSGLCFARIGQRTGYINPTGEFEFELPIEFATPFEGKVAIVQVREEPSVWRVINRKGEYLSAELEIAHSRGFSESAALVWTRTGEKQHYGYVGEHGEYLIEPIYDDAEPFRFGLARVVLNGKEGLLRQDRTIIWSEEIMQRARSHPSRGK